MVICTLLAIQRQLSLMARETKRGHPHLFFPSRDNQVGWQAETRHGHLQPFFHPETIKFDVTQRQNMVIHTLFFHLETIKFDGTWRQNMVIRTHFAIQRQSSLMACKDRICSSAPSLPSRDNQVQHGHPHPFCYPETIMSDGT